MNHSFDELHDTFVAHEHLAPNPDDVLARVDVIAKHMRRRRWAVRATGASVLGAGLVASGIALPNLASSRGGNQTVATIGLADGGSSSPTPSPSPTASPYTQDQEWAEYFADGYDYNDAVQLANIWNTSEDIGQVKADAGLKLLEGEQLPVQPSGTPETADQRAQAAFFAAGYDTNDAITLGQIWKETDLTQVKTEAGQDLLDGKTLPIQPSTSQSSPKPTESPNSDGSAAGDAASVADAEALAVFFADGYDYNDAQTLATTWNETDTYQVKIEAGTKLMNGKQLPIPPSGTPESTTQKDVDFFITAGYDYSDAQQLASMWHETDITQVKAEAGQKLLDGDTLPISP